MSPTKNNPPAPHPTPATAKQSTKGSKKNLNLNLKDVLPNIKKYWLKFTAHISFVAVMVVLIVYLFVVWQIRGLVTAEPSPEAESAVLTSTNIPKIDKSAIDKIQALEQNSPAVQALFNEARNNPFHE